MTAGSAPAAPSIGGNVWVTRSVPPGTTLTQGQNRQEEFAGGAGI